MTVISARHARAQALGGGGWNAWSGDPAAIPPPGAAAFGSAAGVLVNERTVLSLMAVSSCLRVLGDAASGLEPRVYRQRGKRRSNQDPEVDPPQVTADPYADIERFDGDFRGVASLGLNGNIYKHVVDRDDRGNPLTVEILNPSMVKVEMVDGVKTYKLGAIGKELPANDVVQTPWIALASGLVGLNPIELGASAFGIGLAAHEYAGRYYRQGMHPSGILSVEKPLRPGDADRIRDEVATKHGGLAQAFTPIVLDSAAKWQQISITPETAQLLQSRTFTRAEIAGFYGVPPHLIGDTADNGGPWGKGLQEMVMGFALFSLSGYTRRLDASDTALLAAGYYVRRKVSDLFKTNDQMLAQLVQALRMVSVATPNDGREMVGLPPSDEPAADSLFAPINSAHADWLATGDKGPEAGLDEANPGVAPSGGLPPDPVKGS